MTRLRQRDLATFSRTLETLYADASADTLSGRVLAALRGLFDCDFASFSLMDLRRGRWHLSQISPVVQEWPGAEVYQKFLRDDPAAAHIRRTHTKRALKISDFCSLREYHSSKLYAEMFRPVGCDRRLGFAVRNGSPVTVAATLNRKRRDFSEEERTLLDLLRPHLLQANTLAHAGRVAVATRLQAQVSVPSAEVGVGLIELAANGRVQSLTARAAALLRVYFPAAIRQTAGGRLPAALADRIAARSPKAHDVDRPVRPTAARWHFAGPDGRQLQVQLAGDGRQLLLEECDDQTTQALAAVLGLTPREGEVLHWIGEAKTNWAIGRILDISESTVGKHLEKILSKLRVPNRTAAARALAEARSGR